MHSLQQRKIRLVHDHVRVAGVVVDRRWCKRRTTTFWRTVAIWSTGIQTMTDDLWQATRRSLHHVSEKRHAQRAGPRTQGRGLARRQGGRSALTDAVLGLIDTNEPSPRFQESATPRRHFYLETWPALQLGCSCSLAAG